MWRAFLALILCIAVLAGCNDTPEGGYDAETGMFHLPGDDPEMAAAITEARKSVDEFIGHLQSPKPEMEYFAVKKPYPTRGGSTEHIWVEVTEYRDDTFHGTIANEPMDIEGITMGSPVTVGKNEITDWLITTNTGTMGGFTVAVLAKRIN